MIQLTTRFGFEAAAIVYLNGSVNYTTVILNTGERIVISKTLKMMEQRLSNYPNFVRINKSLILNMNYAERHGQTFTMPDQRVVAFSRRKWKEFKHNQF
jgi:two-component system, LytTR family, response regulator